MSYRRRATRCAYEDHRCQHQVRTLRFRRWRAEARQERSGEPSIKPAVHIKPEADMATAASARLHLRMWHARRAHLGMRAHFGLASHRRAGPSKVEVRQEVRPPCWSTPDAAASRQSVRDRQHYVVDAYEAAELPGRVSRQGLSFETSAHLETSTGGVLGYRRRTWTVPNSSVSSGHGGSPSSLHADPMVLPRLLWSASQPPTRENWSSTARVTRASTSTSNATRR